MTRSLTAAVFVAFVLTQGVALVFAQAPAFEVASITPCAPGTPAPPMEHAGITDFTSPGGRFTARATTVQFLMEWAYGIQPAQHSGGPAWLSSDRFDVIAKAPGNATDDEIRKMVQTLPEDRFRLKFHREHREIAAYVISKGKDAPKLAAPKDGEAHGMRFAPHASADLKITTYTIVAMRYSVGQLADTFARQLGSVIVDDTGLQGEFDFTFDLTPDDSTPNPMDPTLLMRALREQIGFSIKSQKTPVDIFVVDGAEKLTAGN